MQKIELHINTENTGYLGQHDIEKFQEIISALIRSGGLTGVKGGQTIIHFDAEGMFQGIQLDYWPFRRRKKLP